jgi:hypothetical protein
VGNHKLHFRGFSILQASIDFLLAPGDAFPSLSEATTVVISGSSAGGLTTLLHADYVADRIHAANPQAVVKAIPEVGFFIDGASIWENRHIMTQVYTRISVFANISTGDPHQVNSDCMQAYPLPQRWRCFMAQYTYPHVRTPLFLLNSRLDQWQTQYDFDGHCRNISSSHPLTASSFSSSP